MRPAGDPGTDYKALVRSGYDRCAVRYAEVRAKESPAGIELLGERLAPGSRVLDLGCGAGSPIARSLAERFAVTGVDFSAEQIRRARRSVPDAEFLESDLLTVDFPRSTFGGVVAFYVLFHLPREEQVELLRRVHGWLAPGGLLLATLSRFDEAPYTEDDFFGVPMYWTHFSWEGYLALLAELGFEIVEKSTVGHGYSQDYGGPAERHPLVLARRPETRGGA